jgi:hypothetical protein
MLATIVVLVATAGMNASAPTEAEVLRAMPRVTPGIPHVYEEFRDDVTVTRTRVGGARIGPRVFVPFLGPVQPVTTNWECVVWYAQTITADFPFPVKVTKRRVQVVYIEKGELAK